MARKYRSFDEADNADDACCAGLDPEERVDILLSLVAAYQELQVS